MEQFGQRLVVLSLCLLAAVIIYEQSEYLITSLIYFC